MPISFSVLHKAPVQFTHREMFKLVLSKIITNLAMKAFLFVMKMRPKQNWSEAPRRWAWSELETIRRTVLLFDERLETFCRSKSKVMICWFVDRNKQHLNRFASRECQWHQSCEIRNSLLFFSTNCRHDFWLDWLLSWLEYRAKFIPKLGQMVTSTRNHNRDSTTRPFRRWKSQLKNLP